MAVETSAPLRRGANTPEVLPRTSCMILSNSASPSPSYPRSSRNVFTFGFVCSKYCLDTTTTSLPSRWWTYRGRPALASSQISREREMPAKRSCPKVLKEGHNNTNK